MNVPLAAAAAGTGAGVGWLSGAAAVALGRMERLREEAEAEEELEQERDAAPIPGGGAGIAAEGGPTVAAGESAQNAVVGEGAPTPVLADGAQPIARVPARPERYGWTWLERVLSPLLAGSVFAVFATREGWGRGLVIHLLWLAILVHIFTFDLKHRLILNRVSYPAAVLAVALSPLAPGLSLSRALAGLAIGFLFFFAMNLVSRGGIGLGDAKLGAFVGAITGFSPDGGDLGAVYAIIYAILLGGAAAIGLLLTRLRRLKDPIPYGPFLCAGAALVLYQSP